MHTNIAELSDIYLFYILEIFRRNVRKYVRQIYYGSFRNYRNDI